MDPLCKNMADFEEKWRHFHNNTSEIFMVVTTDQAQHCAQISFHPPPLLIFEKKICMYIELSFFWIAF
jgi:hypothetical protein